MKQEAKYINQILTDENHATHDDPGGWSKNMATNAKSQGNA